jgi:phosphate transport system protein
MRSNPWIGDLHEIGERVGMVGTRVLHQVAHAIRAFAERDDRLARSAIASDLAVDRDVDEVGTLVRRVFVRLAVAPCALGCLTASLEVLEHLARVGDLAIQIARRSVDLSRLPLLGCEPDVASFGRMVHGRLEDVLGSFADHEVPEAPQALEAELERAHVQVRTMLLARVGRNPATITQVGWLLAMCGLFERIGDRATSAALVVEAMTRPSAFAAW